MEGRGGRGREGGAYESIQAHTGTGWLGSNTWVGASVFPGESVWEYVLLGTCAVAYWVGDKADGRTLADQASTSPGNTGTSISMNVLLV